MELSAFERTLRLIRTGCDIVIEGSTGGISTLTAAERCVSLQADIELASLNPGSVNHDKGVYVNSTEGIAYWAQEMHRRRVKPVIAIFEAGMILNAVALAEQSWMQSPLLIGFVLGHRGALPARQRPRISCS